VRNKSRLTNIFTWPLPSNMRSVLLLMVTLHDDDTSLFLQIILQHFICMNRIILFSGLNLFSPLGKPYYKCDIHGSTNFKP
jgi:hypothetical protein